MATSPAQQLSKRKRLRAVEELYRNGYKALEIWELIGETYHVSRGTIRYDITEIRKAWGKELDGKSELEGKDVRRDARFVHQLACISGVKHDSDTRPIHVDIQQLSTVASQNGPV